jgi:hypothetical protein
MGLTDLDEDGVQELLLSGGTFHMGELQQGARLVDMAGGRLRVLLDFQQTLYDVCDNEFLKDARRVEAAVIYYVPGPKGRFPDLHREDYHAACDGDERTFHLVSRTRLGPPDAAAPR